MAITGPYHETFLMGALADGDGNPYWACGICHHNLSDDPLGYCPTHAQLDRPGLTLVPCEKVPRHPLMWVVAQEEEGYGPLCLHCHAAAGRDRIDALEHATHHACYNRIPLWALRVLRRVGVIGSWHWRSGGACTRPKPCTVIRWRWAAQG